MAGRKKKADAGLLVALASGMSPEVAAQKVGLGLRTVYRRLAEPSFRLQVNEVRAEMVRRVAGMLTAAGMRSVLTFTTLQESAVSESVRLGAARAIIELGGKMRESLEVSERLSAVETRLEALLAGNPVERGGDASAHLGE